MDYFAEMKRIPRVDNVFIGQRNLEHIEFSDAWVIVMAINCIVISCLIDRHPEPIFRTHFF